jgi:ketosteroid isomerase-like protein
MTEHPNAARIRDGYAAFAKGDLAALNDLFA